MKKFIIYQYDSKDKTWFKSAPIEADTRPNAFKQYNKINKGVVLICEENMQDHTEREYKIKLKVFVQ